MSELTYVVSEILVGFCKMQEEIECEVGIRSEWGKQKKNSIRWGSSEPKSRRVVDREDVFRLTHKPKYHILSAREQRCEAR